MESLDLMGLFADIELPLIEVLADMERCGVRVDRKMLGELSRDFDGRLTGIVKEIYALSGDPFNINSPQQLSRVLFDTLRLSPVKKTKTGFSTDTEVLEILSLQHPLPKKILEVQNAHKIEEHLYRCTTDAHQPSYGKDPHHLQPDGGLNRKVVEL